MTKTREPYEPPCQICRVKTRVDLLERVEGVLARRACPECVSKIEEEEREEALAESWNMTHRAYEDFLR